MMKKDLKIQSDHLYSILGNVKPEYHHYFIEEAANMFYEEGYADGQEIRCEPTNEVVLTLPSLKNLPNEFQITIKNDSPRRVTIVTAPDYPSFPSREECMNAAVTLTGIMTVIPGEESERYRRSEYLGWEYCYNWLRARWEKLK